jgi:predicted nucleic acid-binding protein
VLVDTDVLIWHLRGVTEASAQLDALPNLSLSAMSYLERLLGGRRY